MSTPSQSSLRATAESLFGAAVQAADPARALQRHWSKANLSTPEKGGKTIVIAIGKAAPALMREALGHIDGPVEALAVTHHENADTVAGVSILKAGHPVPDADSFAAGRAVRDLLSSATAKDRVIALISGGGSALVPLPVSGVSPEDKSAVNAALLASGLEITDMNLIRQQVSDLKGGGFLRHAAPAPVTAFILSDVIGDDLRAIASGPTVAPLGTAADAKSLLEKANIWKGLPKSVQAHLSQPASPPPSIKAENILIGSNRQSLDAALAAATGLDARIVSDELIGDVADAATTVLDAVASAPTDRPIALIFGGETTVRLTGDGLGGRNQEMALRLALAAEGKISGDWVFLSGGTDGRDGPTEAAGGLVDAASAQRMRAANVDPEALLANNDSNAALAASQDLLMTGATGTNVADVQIFLRAPV